MEGHVNESVNGRVQLLNLCQDATESQSYSYIATGIIIIIISEVIWINNSRHTMYSKSLC